MSEELKNDDLTVVPEAPASAPSDILVGQVIAKQYRVDALLGSGGMSSVYRVTDLVLGRKVALKLLNALLAVDAKQMMRFQQEGRVLNQLSHEHIVKVHHFGFLDDGRPYLVMELVKGISLSDLIVRGGKLSLLRTLGIVRQVCEALAHAHARSIIHRDLKPSNIMLTESDKGYDFVKIVDFGIAKILSEQAFQNLTATGDIFGSPLYMSPEQCGGLPVDGRTDIYSLGCILYECLTGAPPFVGTSSLATMMQHQQSKPLSLREATLGERFPAQIENIVARLLAKEPAGRYERVEDVIQALDAVASPAIEPATETAIKKGESRKAVLVAAVLGSLAFGFLCAFVVLQGLNQRQPPKPAAPVAKPAVSDAAKEALAAARRWMDDPYTEVAKFSSGVALRTAHMDLEPNSEFLEGLSRKPLTAQLQYLDMSETDLSNLALKPIAKLPLRALILRSNRRLTNVDCLAQVRSLHKLDLFGTDVDDEGLVNLNPNLIELNLGDCRITNATLSRLGDLKKLKRLLLKDDSPQLDDRSLKLLAGLSSVDYMVLKGNRFSEKGLKELFRRLPACSFETDRLAGGVCFSENPNMADFDGLHNRQLRCVVVNKNKHFDDACLKELQHHPKLLTFLADETALTKRSVHYLNPGLRQLGLRYVHIGDEGVQYISEHLKNVEKLMLAGTDITDVSLRSLGAMKSLDEVDVRDNPKLTLKAVKELTEARPDLIVECSDKLK